MRVDKHLCTPECKFSIKKKKKSCHGKSRGNVLLDSFA